MCIHSGLDIYIDSAFRSIDSHRLQMVISWLNNTRLSMFSESVLRLTHKETITVFLCTSLITKLNVPNRHHSAQRERMEDNQVLRAVSWVYTTKPLGVKNMQKDE